MGVGMDSGSEAWVLVGSVWAPCLQHGAAPACWLDGQELLLLGARGRDELGRTVSYLGT